MANVLQQYFPMIRTRKEILGEISENKRLRCIWQEWNEEQQKEFMKFCTGAKGIKILYDSFLKRSWILIRRRKGWKNCSH